MRVEQVAELVNAVYTELTGQEAIFAEDLSNVIDSGKTVLSGTEYDKYVKTLVNHIGRMVFVDRPYYGRIPSVLMDAWEFGSILEKVRVELPTATENESWELEDGAVYEQDTFYKPRVHAKFFNDRVTFEVPISITERQVKCSFDSAAQLNGFITMIYNACEKAMAVRLDALVMRTVNNFIAETVHDDYGSAALSSKSGIKAVNLLYLYNQRFNAQLTADAAITNADFLKFAAYTMATYANRIGSLSTLFNIGGTDKQTPADRLHWVLHSDFMAGANAYLQSTTFHDEFTKLPDAESVPYWQGSGTGYGFADTAKVYVKTSENNSVTVTGIVGIMFDRDALGVTNMDRRVRSHVNDKAEFYTNWYKMDAGYFNDFDENFVVFLVA